MIGYNTSGTPFAGIGPGQNLKLQQHLSLAAAQITLLFAQISISSILGARPRV
jgi:hypothetical protein